MNTAAEAVSNRGSGTSMVLSFLLIIFGLLALALPMVTSVGVVLLLAWLIVFDGLTQLVHAFQSKGIGHIAWKLLVAVLYLFAAAYLIGHPALGVAGLTLALGAFFLAEGVVDVVSYFSTRKQGGSVWMLLDGVITLVLGSDDLEAMALQFTLGNWDTAGYQHAHDRHYSSDDGSGRSQARESIEYSARPKEGL